MKWNNIKPFKKLVASGGGSTAGRNNAGRITIYHRGGGAKRLQRKIDLKRSTPSMGVVERLEYDPNRSSRVALVRWIEGVKPCSQKKSEKNFMPPSPKNAEPTTKTVLGQFPLACLAPGLMMRSEMFGTPDKEASSKISSMKDVFVSAFSFRKPKENSLSNFPRFAIAGSKPAVFSPRERNLGKEREKSYSLSDVQRWRKDSPLWEHRLKRKAAVSWASFVREEPVGLAVVANERRQLGKSSTKGANEDRAPLTYIIASDGMEPGKMVMNCDLSSVPARKF